MERKRNNHLPDGITDFGGHWSCAEIPSRQKKVGATTLRKTLFLPFFLVLTLFLVNCAYAQDEIDLSTFPQGLADALNISLFAGQLLGSVILMLMFMLPVVVYTKTLLPPLFVGLLTLGFCIALGYLPTWFLLIISMLIAVLWGSKLREWILGK